MVAPLIIPPPKPIKKKAACSAKKENENAIISKAIKINIELMITDTEKLR